MRAALAAAVGSERARLAETVRVRRLSLLEALVTHFQAEKLKQETTSVV